MQRTEPKVTQGGGFSKIVRFKVGEAFVENGWRFTIVEIKGGRVTFVKERVEEKLASDGADLVQSGGESNR